ncbi:trypsin-like serine protease [Actinomadura barringtoniae]|uniref:Trypsin-like serine protease n=1 Tax=Actinomadura barringtoniae TaxID=1427535 RepID=A0A939PKN4_9ACTN|nr:trypsin-like serine protease [Actinomadura barringtoniae]MBO2454541.1 trypsin-like serine protease [Actinomadura barringtoniae]
MRLSSPRIVIAGTAAAACAVAGGIAVAATNDSAKPVAKTGASAQTADPNAQVVVHSEGASAASVQAFWTPARIKAALATKPKDMPASEVAPTSEPAAAANAAPEIDIEGTSPDASTSAANTKASTQAVVNTRVWTKHGRPPARTIGRLIAVDHVDSQGTWYSLCSATVVTAKNKRTLITAGHCVNRGKNGGWLSHYAFIPDLPKNKKAWPIQDVVALKGWTQKGDFRYDIAGARVRAQIQRTTGSQGIAFNFKHRRYGIYSFGYPADLLPSGKKLPNYNLLRYCSGRSYPVNYGGGSIGMGLNCTMGHGASGGPWIYGLSKKGYGRVVGVNSTHSLRTNQMNTPNFGSVAVAVYKATAK